MRTSFIAIRGMVSGCPVRYMTTDVPVEGVPASVRGTTCRPPSRARLSAFSILLISQYLHQSQRGKRRGSTYGQYHDGPQKDELDSQALQFRRAPQVREHHHDRGLVGELDPASDPDARIELQPGIEET